VEWRRTLIEEIGRTTNRLVDVLKGYFPQAIDGFEHRDTLVFCDFLRQWSRLSAVQQVSDEPLQQFFCEHHSRYKECNAPRMKCLRNGIPLTQDPAIVESSQLMGQALVSQLRSLLTSVRQFECQIDRLFNQLSDAAIFAALPHAGTNLAPRLLMAFGEDRTRYQSAQDLLQYAGIAPVTERSGKKCWVHWQASPEGGFPSGGNWRAGERRDSYAKLSSNGRMNRAKHRSGQRHSIKLRNRRERRTKLQFERWHSSGFAFCFAAGRTEFPTMKPSICLHCLRRAPH
jgi:Transposase IS116/IS110/IS902 family